MSVSWSRSTTRCGSESGPPPAATAQRVEVAAFLEQHLKAVGCKRKVFEGDAIAAIFHHSRGIPRLVQNIALDAMLAAMAAEKKTVDAQIVQQAIIDAEGL